MKNISSNDLQICRHSKSFAMDLDIGFLIYTGAILSIKIVQRLVPDMN
jgi:hypothetical protein